jgi:MoxR-like ATPase
MRVGSLSLLRPIFSNIILADEINRTPPKTQAALEAMQERSVTIAGENHQLDLPYFVLATQNPIEQEGTYPLPEAQLDRFMFAIKLEYPSLKRKFKLLKERPLLRQQLLVLCLNLRKLSIFSS